MTIPSDPERALLNACIRLNIPTSETGVGIGPLPGSINWHRLLWLGRQHGVLAHLRHVLISADWTAECPPAINEQLQIFHEVNQLRSLAYAREICQLHDLFERNGLTALPVGRWMAAQGADGFAAWIEPENKFCFIVPASETTRAGRILIEAGHPLESDPEKLIKAGYGTVQLDTAFDDHPAAPRLWEKSSTFILGGRIFRRLAPAHWLLWRTPRHSDLGNISLSRAFEIICLCRQIAPDAWAEVRDEASRFGVLDVMVTGINTCHQVLELPAPAPLIGWTDVQESSTISQRADRLRGMPKVHAPFLPTPVHVARRMLQLCGIGPDDCVCDLGCGDGRIAILAAKEFGARSRGVDRNPERIAEATAAAAKADVSARAEFECADLFRTDLSMATVVTCYLLPALMPSLLEKLRREVKPGTRIVSHEFVFPGWPPEATEIIRVGPSKMAQIYLWRIQGSSTSGSEISPSPPATRPISDPMQSEE